MCFIFVILGLILGIVLFLIGIKTNNVDIISIGSVLSIFFLLICINIYIPNLIHTLNSSVIRINNRLPH